MSVLRKKDTHTHTCRDSLMIETWQLMKEKRQKKSSLTIIISIGF